MAQHQARRVAKQRRRQQRQGRSNGGDRRAEIPERDGVDPIDVALDALRDLAMTIAHRQPIGEQRRRAVAVWQQAPNAATVAADALLRGLLRTTRNGHWTVNDLVECGRRRLDRDARELMAEAMWHDRHSAGVTGAWRAEVEALLAEPRRDPGVPWFAAFAGERGWTVEQSLDVLVGVVAEVSVWPDLRATTDARNSRLNAADTAMLAKVRALLAKAESTEFEHEAEAFTAKAQSLMARHAIDRAMLADASSPTDVVVTRVWLDAPYVVAKASLYVTVGAANRCRVVLAEAFGFLTIVGEAGDLRATTLLAASLQVQAVRAMTSLGSRVRANGTSATRSFRQTFLTAYAERIGERLTAVSDAVVDEVGSGALVPVLAARVRRVDDRFDELFPALQTRTVQAFDDDGWRAGRAAADLVHLTVGEALDAAS